MMREPDNAASSLPETHPLYSRLLVALDSSEPANQGLNRGLALAALTAGARITGIHAFAARLHDDRFRQMEGGLPEQYRQEKILEEQRETHDTLITKGLNLISESYLDVGQKAADAAGIPYDRLSLEGKNYRVLADAVRRGDHDLLILGARGVGAVPGESIGGVCERVVRRTTIDTLVVKPDAGEAADGSIVATLDGSERSYGGLLTALELGRRWQRPVILVAAFDPYYHYVVFNNITRVLSEEGAEVFKFEEQEKLHEEIIDSGLAKIYQAHLDVGESIARERGMTVECVLLAGKPTVSIARFLEERKPSLVTLGKTGIHADDGLDIGWVTENLLRAAPCDLLISCREHTPEVDRVAGFTTTWSREAEARMERVPVFARKMARMAILRYAQDRGHTVITERIVEEATAALMPNHAHKTMEAVVRRAEESAPTWSRDAEEMVAALSDESLRANVRRRSEKSARREKSEVVTPAHVTPFLNREEAPEPVWSPEAEARLQRVPEGFMRDATRKSILAHAREEGAERITLAVAEAGIDRARRHMAAKMARGDGHPGGPPPSRPAEEMAVSDAMPWDADAQRLLENIPAGMSRQMSRRAVESIARRQGLARIDAPFFQGVLETFKKGSARVKESLPWSDDARAMLEVVPVTVRGMLVREIEGWVSRQGWNRVESQSVTRVFEAWKSQGVFHLAPGDERNG